MSKCHKIGKYQYLNCITVYLSIYEINVREYRRGNQKWTIQRNWQHRLRKKNTICVRHHYYMQTYTNNVNKTLVLIQTTGGKAIRASLYKNIVTDITTRDSERKDT